MKINKLFLIIGLGVILIPFWGVQAVVSTTKTTTGTMSEADKVKFDALRLKLEKESAEFKASLGTSRAEIDKKLLETKDAIKKNLDSKAQARVRVIIEKIFTKLDNQAGKISLIDTKIGQKISDLEKEGSNMSKARAQYEIAKISLSKTNSEILALRVAATEQLSKGTSKEIFRSLVKTAEESLKNTGNEYRKILPLLVKINN